MDGVGIPCDACKHPIIYAVAMACMRRWVYNLGMRVRFLAAGTNPFLWAIHFLCLATWWGWFPAKNKNKNKNGEADASISLGLSNRFGCPLISVLISLKYASARNVCVIRFRIIVKPIWWWKFKKLLASHPSLSLYRYFYSMGYSKLCSLPTE